METFAPIIGGGFDQDAQQNQFWTNRNIGTIEANIGRLAQKQQTDNNYLLTRAQLEQAAEDKKAAAIQHGQDAAAAIAERRASLGENARQFDKGFEWSRNEQQKVIDEADRFATAAAPEVAKTGSEKQQAFADLNQAQAAYEKAAAQAGALIPSGKATYNRSAGFYVATKSLTPDEKAALDLANSKLADLVPVLSAAKLTYQEKANSFDDLVKEAQKHKLTVQMRDNQHAIFNPHNGRWFKASGASTTKTATPQFTGFSPVMGNRAMADQGSMPVSLSPDQQSYAENVGFDSGISAGVGWQFPGWGGQSSPVTVQPASGPLKVGKFVVIPQ